MCKSTSHDMNSVGVSGEDDDSSVGGGRPGSGAAGAARTAKRELPADSTGDPQLGKVQRRAAFRRANQEAADAARAAKEARRRAVLVLFSGPAGRPDGFEAKCAEESVRCVMIDTCHGG